MRKLLLLSVLHLTMLLSFIGCNNSLSVEESEVIPIPAGYTVEAAAIQQNANGKPVPFLLLKKENAENDYRLFPSGLEFSITRLGRYCIGPDEGSFLLWGSDENLDHKKLIRGTEIIPIPEGVLPVICPNGRDYAWEERDTANRKIRKLSINGKVVDESEKNFSDLTFSPDGSRLIYASGPGDYIGIHDALNKTAQMQMPSQNLKELKFSFGPDNILRVHYEYDEFSGIRYETSFLPVEPYYNDKELWFTRLVRRSELFYSTQSGSGILLGGDEADLPDRLTDYHVSRDCRRLLTLGFKNLSSSKENGSSLIPFLSTQKHNLELQISENGIQLVGEKVTLTKLSGGINAALPPTLYSWETSADRVRSGGIDYRMGFTSGGDSLVALSIPSGKGNEPLLTILKAGGKEYKGFTDFRLPPGTPDTPADCAILIDSEGFEHILAGDQLSAGYTAIHAVSSKTDGSLAFIAENNEGISLYRTIPTSNTTLQKKETAKKLGLPAIRNLSVNSYVQDSDGTFAATNMGVFFSFANSTDEKDWEHFDGFDLPLMNEENRTIRDFAFTGDRGYLIDDQYLWYSPSGKGYWRPLVPANKVRFFSLQQDNLYIIETSGSLREFTGTELSGTQTLWEPDSWKVEDWDFPTYPASNARFMLTYPALFQRETGIEFREPATAQDDPRRSDLLSTAAEGTTGAIGTRSGLYLTRDEGNSWKRLDASAGLSGDVISRIFIEGEKIALQTAETLINYNARGGYCFNFGDERGVYYTYPDPALRYAPSFDSSRPDQMDPRLRFTRGEELTDREDVVHDKLYREKGCYNGLSFSVDGGKTWKKIRLDQLHGYNPDRMFPVYTLWEACSSLFMDLDDTLIVSHDWGQSWDLLELPESEHHNIYQIKEIKSGIYLFLDRGREIYRMDGTAWEPVIFTFGDFYQGRNCTEIKTDDAWIYTRAEGPLGGEITMKFSKQDRIWICE